MKSIFDERDLDLAMQHSAAQRSRLIWAPVIANCGGLISISSFIGGARHPDAVFNALLFPFCCFASGLMIATLGLLVEASYSKGFSQGLRLMSQAREAQQEAKQLFTEWARAALDRISIAQAVGGDKKAEAEKDKLLRGYLASLQKANAKLNAATSKLSEYDNPPTLYRTRRLAWFLIALALLLFALGIAYTVIGHAVGHVRFEVVEKG